MYDTEAVLPCSQNSTAEWYPEKSNPVHLIGPYTILVMFLDVFLKHCIMKTVRDTGDKTLFFLNLCPNRGQWFALRSKRLYAG